MQFSLSFYHFLSLTSKYSPQHPVFTHPQNVFSQIEEPSFTRRYKTNIRLNFTYFYIRMAQDRVQWRAFVNTVMNLHGSIRKRDIF
jgi:hypothetical protein